ncbi:hypothetical protein I302_101760 [Kwoniella bestiolae CBS 10118]|uniref:Uncharacterized protein n=1 Tax=Kwoniella bestiolae CBS 10118 TaxID=1296100 RepID=A0A1B9GD50_9TREE|nr:hypothetical protein I302_00439 [Kwoniella bestiolae CBS 10118]OCF28948.1 hypothetical protein I302_00439 [Kwoniella bestiolae CBS 10118]
MLTITEDLSLWSTSARDAEKYEDKYDLIRVGYTPSESWTADGVEIPDDLNFGTGKASVIATSSLDPSYQGTMRDVRRRVDTRITWKSDNPPSRESFIQASKLESILGENLKDCMLRSSARLRIPRGADLANHEKINGQLQTQWADYVRGETAQLQEVYMMGDYSPGTTPTNGCTYVDNDTFAKSHPQLTDALPAAGHIDTLEVSTIEVADEGLHPERQDGLASTEDDKGCQTVSVPIDSDLVNSDKDEHSWVEAILRARKQNGSIPDASGCMSSCMAGTGILCWNLGK